MTSKGPFRESNLSATDLSTAGKDRAALDIGKVLKDAYDVGTPEHLPEDLQALVDRIAGQKSDK